MAHFDRFIVKHRHTGEPIAQPGVARGETVYECLARNGVPIRTTCKGSTICGLCVVLVEGGDDVLAALPEVLADERALLDRHGNTEPNARLACRLQLPQGHDHLVVALDPAPPGWPRRR